MIAFQLVILPILLMFIATFVGVVRYKRGLIPTTAVLVVLSVALAIVAALVDPTITQSVAELIGIGRGADLAMYSAVLFLFLLSFVNYTRTQKLYLKMVKIVRGIALSNVQYPKN